ncbi:MAG: hypothetical protein QNJ46_29145 [Leptolyngbyaceae cyanobacterium MO_188.B28]|nr:hypothetical protein [Leptolyngbyaceae cyanobacterium MO_188.B28]
MAKLSSQPLRPNPFHTYRDPQTGRWLVVKSAFPDAEDCFHVDLLNSTAHLRREKFTQTEFRIQHPKFSIQAIADV